MYVSKWFKIKYFIQTCHTATYRIVVVRRLKRQQRFAVLDHLRMDLLTRKLVYDFFGIQNIVRTRTVCTRNSDTGRKLHEMFEIKYCTEFLRRRGRFTKIESTGISSLFNAFVGVKTAWFHALYPSMGFTFLPVHNARKTLLRQPFVLRNSKYNSVRSDESDSIGESDLSLSITLLIII